MVELSRLADPFPAEAISWRVGSTTGDKTRGLPLCYIDARDVMDRLDEVCGPENWQCRYQNPDGSRVVCEIGIRIAGEWIWKADGAGETDYEAEKGALSDSLKRAAVRWGIGRYLYGIKAPWVQIKGVGKSFVVDPTELPKLNRMLQQPPAKPQAEKTAERREVPKNRAADPAVPQSMTDDPAFSDLVKVTGAGKEWKVTAIQQSIREFCQHLDGVTSADEFKAILADFDVTLRACEAAIPKWWAGPCGDATPIRDRIQQKTDELLRIEAQFNPDRIIA